MGVCGNTEALGSDRSKTRRVYLAPTIPYRPTGKPSEFYFARRVGFSPRGALAPLLGTSSGSPRKNLLDVERGFWYIQWPDLCFQELDVRSNPGSRDGRHLCSFARIAVPHLKASSAGDAELRLARPRPTRRLRHLLRHPHRASRPHRHPHPAMRPRRLLTPRRPRRRHPSPSRASHPRGFGARCSICPSPASSRPRSSSSCTCCL
jgi:hypothetical protein